MDYKEKYKNVMEILKKAASDPECEDERFCCVVYGLFPELKENEDEKVRKALIEIVHDSTRDELWAYHISEEEAIAWLEKQGEPVEINPTEFDIRLQALIEKFDSLPKEELIGSLSFWLNVVQNDGTYKPDEKQGGQKPVDKVESFDEFEGLTDFERTLADICIGWIGEELGWKQYIKDNADVLLKIAIEKFNSVQDASFKQKPAWSEEDEHRLNRISDFIWKNRKGDTDEIYQQEQDVNWLKSLRPQPKHEWSEEDKDMLKNILATYKTLEIMLDLSTEQDQDILTSMNFERVWLKSLKQRIGGRSYDGRTIYQRLYKS